MRFMGPEEGGIVVVSRAPGAGLVGIFAAGSSLSDSVFPSMGGGKGAVAKVGTVAHKGAGSPQNPLLMWVSLAFYIFLH
jgi:hypothetical protein